LGGRGADSRPESAPALMEALPANIRARLHRLIDDGTVDKAAFDPESLTSLRALTDKLQDKVLQFLESERVFLMNSRSKSGFLVAACDKAKTGALDAMGMGAQDPWRDQLRASAVPKRAAVELVPEQQWLEQHGAEPARITVDVACDREIGVTSIALSAALTLTAGTIKERLATIGVKVPVHKMKLKDAGVGFLADARSLAFYNVRSGSVLQLLSRKRGGVRFLQDQSDPASRR